MSEQQASDLSSQSLEQEQRIAKFRLQAELSSRAKTYLRCEDNYRAAVSALADAKEELVKASEAAELDEFAVDHNYETVCMNVSVVRNAAMGLDDSRIVVKPIVKI